MRKSIALLGGEPAARPVRRFLKELLIVGSVTLCVGFAFSGLSRLSTLSPATVKTDTGILRPASTEPPAMVERRMSPAASAGSDVAASKDLANGANAAVSVTLAKRAAAERTSSAAAKMASAKPVALPHPDPARATSEIAAGERAATPVDIRSAAQRIADERQRDPDMWQRMASAAATLNDMVPGRKYVAQAVDVVRDRVSDLMSLVR